MKFLRPLIGYFPVPDEERYEFFQLFLLLLFFSISAAFGMRNFICLKGSPKVEIRNEEALSSIMHEVSPQRDVEADELLALYDVCVKSRNHSEGLAALISASAHCPIVDLSVEFEEASHAAESEATEPAPSMTIKAIVIMGGKGAAAVDIAGERAGEIVRAGYLFGGGKGRITGIDAGGVEWTWAKKKYRTGL